MQTSVLRNAIVSPSLKQRINKYAFSFSANSNIVQAQVNVGVSEYGKRIKRSETFCEQPWLRPLFYTFSLEPSMSSSMRTITCHVHLGRTCIPFPLFQRGVRCLRVSSRGSSKLWPFLVFRPLVFWHWSFGVCSYGIWVFWLLVCRSLDASTFFSLDASLLPFHS